MGAKYNVRTGLRYSRAGDRFNVWRWIKDVWREKDFDSNSDIFCFVLRLTCTQKKDLE